MKSKPKSKPKSNSKSPLYVGNTVLIRGVTCYYTGRIVHLSADEIVLVDAAWIADTGRFSTALATGELHEIEPYPDGCRVSVNRAARSDASDWPHPLPRTIK